MNVIKKSMILLFTAVCFFIAGCDPMTDFSVHTAKFCVVNATAEEFYVTFSSESTPSVFEDLEFNVFPTAEEALNKTFAELKTDDVNVSNSTQSFIPGIFYQDINGIVSSEKIVPSFVGYKLIIGNSEVTDTAVLQEFYEMYAIEDVQERMAKLNELQQKYGTFDYQPNPIVMSNNFKLSLRYDSNPEYIMTITTATLLPEVDRAVFDQIFDLANDDVKSALNKVYFASEVYPTDSAKINFSGATIPMEMIEAINILQEIDGLHDETKRYYLF